MAVSDLPGYVQGYVFSDDAAYYNSTDEYFIDQAGFSAFPASRLEITEGTPSFVDVNAARGMVLDNTVQGFFNPPAAWKGSVIIVMGGPGRATANDSLTPIITGGAASINSNTSIRWYRISAGSYRFYMWGAGAVIAPYRDPGDDSIYAMCMSLDQLNRVGSVMDSAGAITSSPAVADNSKAVEGFHAFAAPASAEYGERTRFGNISGVQGDVAAATNSLVICELHYFNDILTSGDTTDVETEMLALEAIYG